jgi:hypothetical protein
MPERELTPIGPGGTDADVAFLLAMLRTGHGVALPGGSREAGPWESVAQLILEF